MHLTPKDAPCVRAAFPDYNGKHIQVHVDRDSVDIYNTDWDSGSKRVYVLVELATLRSVPYTGIWPLGCVVVVRQYSGVRQYIYIYARPGDVDPVLPPPPVELTDSERVVLEATKCYKSSYGGISNYRYHEAHRQTGITLEDWNTAKTSLQCKGFLNKAGAVTNEGRNALS